MSSIHRRPFCSLSLLGIALGLAAAEDAAVNLPPLVVTAPHGPEAPAVRLPPWADAGQALRDLPGVEGIRMGGIGIDPVLRGQSGSRIQVVADGACPYGGCPNRMDPPTAYAPAGAAVVSVEPGGATVRRPGAPAGAVSIDRPTPRFEAGQPWRASAGGRYASNGHVREAVADLAGGLPAGFVRATASAASAGDYVDGGGNQVRSGHETAKYGGTVGWTPSASTTLEASLDAVAERDVLFAGAGMDAPASDGLVGRIRLRSGLPDGGRLVADLYRSEVDHRMDNYSLRPLAGMAMRAPSTSDATGGRLMADLRLGGVDLGLGGDAEDLRQSARRYAGMDVHDVDTLQSVLWPDARIARAGAWADAGFAIGWRSTLTAGVRVDAVRSSVGADRLDPAGAAMSPDALYRAYYGHGADDRTEVLAGGLLRLDRPWSGSGTFALAVSRTMRAADITERFIAANGSPAANRWVGNPGIGAEAHHQLQAMARWRDPAVGSWRAEAWIDRVDDFIRRDRARGQDGLLRSDGATVYRNTEAVLAGFALSGALEAGRWCRLDADASWTWGRDLDEHVPLAQIPPLAGRIGATVRGPRGLSSTLAMRWAARQTQADDDAATGSGVDAGETAAWAVLAWAADWRPVDGATVSAGIDNLLDRAYAEHLNKPSAFDTAVQRVAEPGRSFWIGVEVTY